MTGGFLTGINTYLPAWKLIQAGKLWRYLWIPGLISLAAGSAIFLWGIAQTVPLTRWLVQYYPFEVGKGIVQALAGVLAVLVVGVIVLLLFRYLVMVLVAPFMSLLSEKIETQLTGKTGPPFSLAGFMGDLVRGIRIALRNIWWELFLTLVVVIAGLFVPVIGQIGSAVIIFFIQAYYAGFGNMDYTLERRRYTVAQSKAFVRANRGLAIGNGTIFLLLLMIPVAGLFLAPALGTGAATLTLQDNGEKQPL